MSKVSIVIIDSEYCDYLRRFDDRIYKNKEEKHSRPYVGILFSIGEFQYFAPLSSPKKKHESMKNSIDFLKIENKYVEDGVSKKQLIGVVNFNNMIPVKSSFYKLIDFENHPESFIEEKYFNLLKLDFRFLNENWSEVYRLSYKLYHLYKSNKIPEKLKSRCCNFPLLEKKCETYEKVTV